MKIQNNTNNSKRIIIPILITISLVILVFLIFSYLNRDKQSDTILEETEKLNPVDPHSRQKIVNPAPSVFPTDENSSEAEGASADDDAYDASDPLTRQNVSNPLPSVYPDENKADLSDSNNEGLNPADPHSRAPINNPPPSN